MKNLGEDNSTNQFLNYLIAIACVAVVLVFLLGFTLAENDDNRCDGLRMAHNQVHNTIDNQAADLALERQLSELGCSF